KTVNPYLSLSDFPAFERWLSGSAERRRELDRILRGVAIPPPTATELRELLSRPENLQALAELIHYSGNDPDLLRRRDGLRILFSRALDRHRAAGGVFDDPVWYVREP